MAVADIEAYDFTFRAVDEEGAYCRYDALYSFVDDATGRTFLVYADAQAGQDGEVALYASPVADPDQLERAQAVVDAGSTPKKPPLIELGTIEDQADWDLVDEALELVEQEEEEDD